MSNGFVMEVTLQSNITRFRGCDLNAAKERKLRKKLRMRKKIEDEEDPEEEKMRK